MPAVSVAVGVSAFGEVQIGLPSLLPQGVPGCSLFVSPDSLDLLVPAAGTVQTPFAIPDVSTLVGQRLRYQVVPFEVGAAGAITAVTSSNALRLTFGSF